MEERDLKGCLALKNLAVLRVTEVETLWSWAGTVLDWAEAVSVFLKALLSSGSLSWLSFSPSLAGGKWTFGAAEGQ